MPVRVACNIAYAMLTDGLDSKQRREFDAQLYGWDADNEKANQALRAAPSESGGES